MRDEFADFPDAEVADAPHDTYAGGGNGHPLRVVVHGDLPAQGDAQPSHDEFGDFPDAPPDRSLTDYIGMGVRGLEVGMNSLPDIVAGPVNALVNALPGEQGLSTTPFRDAANAHADAMHMAAPVTDQEQLVNAAMEGAGGSLPFMGGAPVTALAAGAMSGAGGELARQSGAGPGGQLLATIAGGALGAGGVAAAGKAAGAFGERELNPLMQAFERQQVEALPADVGGHFTRMLSAGISKLTLGGMLLEEAAKKSIASAQAAKERIAGQIGTVADELGAGQSARRGAEQSIKAMATKESALHEAIPIPHDAPATTGNTQQRLSEINAGLSSNDELSALISDNRLQAFEKAIAGKTTEVPTGLLDADGNAMARKVPTGGLSWGDLKAFRSYVGELKGKQSLQNDTSQAALGRLYGALSEDMRATASGHGPKALRSFERANTYSRAMHGRIDNVLTHIVGKDLNKSGEDAFRQIQSWAGNRGDVTKVAQALRSMPEEEAATVRASIFNKLGDAPAGNQNGAGTVFSPAAFVTHWNKMPGRAKSALFPGAEYRQSIDDLVSITDAQKAAGKLGMGSPTAHLLQAGHVLGRASAFGTSLFINPLASLAIAADVGGELAVGKLLASPRFARWLASAPAKPNPAAQLAHINRLTAIAAAQPQIANDVLGLQQRLAQAFTGQPLAASGPATGQEEANGR